MLHFEEDKDVSDKASTRFNHVEGQEFTKYDLNAHMYRLLQKEPFFAALSRMIDKTPSKMIPTAGVRFNKQTLQFEMLYNPDFFLALTDDQKLAVLKHEMYHLVFHHTTTRNPAGDDPLKARIWNFAADLAINSHIEDLPEFCLKAGQGFFKKYAPGQSAEAYYGKLTSEAEKFMEQMMALGAGGEGEGKDQQFDAHSTWSSSPGNSNGDKNGNGGVSAEEQAAQDDVDIAKERLDQCMRKAVSEVSNSSNGWGTVHGDVQKDILSYLSGTVNWKNVLRYFIKQSLKADKSSTVKKINKRYPYMHPGKKINRVAKIAIAIDQSGSVSDELLVKFFTELNGLSNLATFTVIPFDTEVVKEHVFIWKKGQRVNAKRVSCGGTDFSPVARYVNERDFDGLVMLSDLCAPKPIPCRVQRVWMTNEENAKQPYFETRERILIIK